MTRLLLGTLLLLGALAAAAAASESSAPAPAPLGMVGSPGPLRLVRLDPSHLRPLPGPGVRVGSGGCASRLGGSLCWTVPAWSFSPGGTRLAVAAEGHELRVVNVRRLRLALRLPLEGGAVGGLAWLAPPRLLAVQEEAGSGRQRLLTVDLTGGRVTATQPLGGSVVDMALAGRRLVLLIAPAQKIGPARLVVAESDGRLAFVPLGIVAGSRLLPGRGHRAHELLPGLAVDPAGDRAFVSDPAAVVEVDLRRLTASRHLLRQPGRALARRAKRIEGWWRLARWLDDGLLAVAGSDTEGGRTRPAGLSLVDTRTWTVRVLDPDANSFVTASGLLLAVGPTGLAAFGVDGELRFRLFEGKPAWVVQVYGGLAYVDAPLGGAASQPLRVVDLRQGRVIGERPPPLPWLVTAPTRSWWG